MSATAKTELEDLKDELEDLIETDYTAESWKALQDLIARAESVASQEEYESIKGELTTDKLVIAPFEKKELNDVLLGLIGKSEKDYTEESWKDLIDAIEDAEDTKLASEYDKIKGKLKISALEEREDENPIISFFQDLSDQEKISLALGVCVGILLLIIIIMAIKHRRENDEDYEPRRRR